MIPGRLRSVISHKNIFAQIVVRKLHGWGGGPSGPYHMYAHKRFHSMLRDFPHACILLLNSYEFIGGMGVVLLVNHLCNTIRAPFSPPDEMKVILLRRNHLHACRRDSS